MMKSGTAYNDCPVFFVPQIFLPVAVLLAMIYAGLAADLFVRRCSGPASGSHCWRQETDSKLERLYQRTFHLGENSKEGRNAYIG